MSLVQMSFSGGALILAVTVVRALALNKLPKQAFCILWLVAALRLLVPVSVPSPLSVYTLAEQRMPAQVETAFRPVMPSVQPGDVRTVPDTPMEAPPAEKIPVWRMVWTAGSLACAAFFTVSYVWYRRRFRESLPVESPAVREWLAEHRLHRPVDVRQCETVSAPLTYGIFRPVILLPKEMEWGEPAAYVLEHELVHIRRFDAAWKLALAAAVCVHWFNPLAWVMYVLANRDLELSCDEAVVRRFGLGKKSAYALALIGMEETKSGLSPLANSFSRNAIEERIIAIMKMKKTSIAAVLLAAVLVCGLSVGFATSAAEQPEDLRRYLTHVPAKGFTDQESRWLLSLWFDGYEDMTVAEYQEKMWTERDNPEDMELVERFSQGGVQVSYYDDERADRAANAYADYFFSVYEPLTASRWQSRDFWRSANKDGWIQQLKSDPNIPDPPARYAYLEYTFTLHILDAEKLTVREYEQAQKEVKDAMTDLLWQRTEAQLRDAAYMETFLDRETAALAERLSTGSLEVQIDYGFRPIEADDLERAQSDYVSQIWDEQLAPYAPFGLTWKFDDPDNDGNGLTMYYQGREVSGIIDEQENIWITEHTGSSIYAADAIELYVVYENGKIAGLRPATAAEQAEWDRIRAENKKMQGSADTNPARPTHVDEEQREFPNATAEDYASFLELMKGEDTTLPAHASMPYRDYRDMTLSQFNQHLLDWGNENQDAYDRIMCDRIWEDYAVELSEEEKRFVSVTCNLSGTENGMMVRSLRTGRAEEDPGFSVNLPERVVVESGATAAWCDLFYQCSYHVSDKSVVTVRERDRCMAGLMSGIGEFWNETDMDTLLRMTEGQVVNRLNEIAAEYSTDSVRITPMTENDVHFEAMDERGIR